MVLSMCTAVLADRFSDKEVIKILKDAGFDAFDYTVRKSSYAEEKLLEDTHIEYAGELRRYAEKLGIVCNQAHAPIPSNDEGEEYIKIVRSIEMAGALGAKIIVIHPLKAPGELYQVKKNELFHRNMAFFRSLIPYAEKSNIKIAIENMYSIDENKKAIVSGVCAHGDEFCKYVDTLDSEYIVACLDTGHVALTGDTVSNLMYNMGHRVQALHVHDVDFVNDNHILPYTGKMDWNEVCKALTDVGYDGDFTYEACNFFSPYMDDDFIPIAAKFAEEVGRSLIRKIERAKLDL
ncbi:MAG: sugar phosphate isomerase/epimerase [Oscillospiraceae bacterium]|nr:sugar phosphate isomerase/epimerase [Oscillospiraceae bacterium]